MSYRPEKYPPLMPYLTITNADKAIAFYRDGLGFELLDSVTDESGNVNHVEMKKDGIVIMFAPEGTYGSTRKAPANSGHQVALSLYIYCADTDALCAQAKKHGAVVLMEPQDTFWGDRYCLIRDPNGYEWGLGTHLGKK